MKKDDIGNIEKWRPIPTMMEYLCVSRENILQWIEKKGMPANKVGRQWKFNISEIDEWIRSDEAAEKNTTDDNYNGGLNHGD